MNKFLKTIFITSIAVFSAGFLLLPLAFAEANDNLVVQFEQTPLFNEANFLPGQDITRWVKVINNSTQTQRIATEAINKSDPNRLGDILNLEIKEGGVTRYNDALSKFFNSGEIFLSNLAGGGTQAQYDFIVTFYSGAGDPFQGKSLSFDILVGFQGTEGGLLPGAGGGGGGFLPPGLTIPSESVRSMEIGETSVTITWTTSYFSTSQVIYAKEGEKHTLDLTDNAGVPPLPPKYGYAHTTVEYDTSPKVTSHSVTISGLTPGTTYYFRAVSHGSLAITQEYNFTTLGQKQEITVTLPQETSQIEQGNGLIEQGFEAVAGGLQKVVSAITRKSRGSEKTTEITLANEQPIVEPITEDMQAAEAPGEATAEIPAKGLLAAIAGLSLRGWLIIIIISLLALLILFFLARRERKKKNQSIV